jgi:hypothetical protein
VILNYKEAKSHIQSALLCRVGGSRPEFDLSSCRIDDVSGLLRRGFADWGVVTALGVAAFAVTAAFFSGE